MRLGPQGPQAMPQTVFHAGRALDHRSAAFFPPAWPKATVVAPCRKTECFN